LSLVADPQGGTMVSTEAVVVVTKTLVLAFGGLVAFYAARAYRRTGSRALRSLTVGLCLIVVGALLAGVAHQVLGAPLAVGVAVHSGFTALGFLTMAYSLYVDTTPADGSGSPSRTGR
jgi:heme A synthase